MKKEIKEKWLTALRSGKYKQGTGCLKDSKDCFCCLGVLTDLYAKEHDIKWDGGVLQGDTDLEYELPTRKVVDWAGLHSDDPGITVDGVEQYLAEFNDHGNSFNIIADIIENQL